MTFAGVAVRKGFEVFLTVAFYTWKGEYAKDLKKEGSLQLYQLSVNVVSRVGLSDFSDIGLDNNFKDGISLIILSGNQYNRKE